MPDTAPPVTVSAAKFEGFSREELLRRAAILRNVAESASYLQVRNQYERLARRYEEEARRAR